MKVTGLITEYNPFHLGHSYHLSNSKQISSSDFTVCVMSGNFVQRGMPALLDKWTRTDMALKNGIDLVLELPTIHAISSAEFFAFGAVSTLNSLNIIDNLCFGSEAGELSLIKETARILVDEPFNFRKDLKEKLHSGLPFPKARAEALKAILKEHNNCLSDDNLYAFLSSSNNILGIEYMKALHRLNSNINAYTIKREGSNYNSENLDNLYASASAIRKSLQQNQDLSLIKPYVPDSSYEILNTFLENKYSFASYDKYFSYIKYKIISSENLVHNIPEAKDGLSYKIINELKKSSNIDEFILNVKSKRYTYSRISRILCSLFLDIDSNTLTLRNKAPNYIRVLGFNPNGAKILKTIKKNSDIKIITKLPKIIDDPMLSLDIKATNLYSLLVSNIRLYEDYLKSPIIIK
ncbi:Predicted nucleotidyltransferase [Clostridium cavendishii DSM 21758]|uniref:tRNA(Met) cytidine acetate ligase n=1 Tax=Clostridium cavendishii DSM 21758 TaxID=1121302 RepID=A0A1M6K860_9CLOT|nr:nucleotidyltransferase [Clostridium cavendishii]SHJ55027.1 Predicted nucleotidyltransferase [Clostridium cavendishii DSM 21758]